MPDERPLHPIVVGDAPALADVSVTLGSTNIPLWALVAWWQRPAIWNMCSNGDFEDDVDGWSVAAVSGVLANAGTSITRSTTAARNKYGAANGQIVCPATANSGAAFRINRRFYQGRDYVIVIWYSSASQTTAIRARLGVSGDIASSSSPNLTTTPTFALALWNPTADRDGAYGVFEVTAATATTMNIDGVAVFESRAVPLTNNIVAGDTSIVVDRIPDEWPAAPFLAAMGGGGAPNEVVRVDSIDSSTKTLTVVRGLEGTTAAGHTAGDALHVLPEIRYHYEGKGAQPPVGVIEAESADTTNLFTWAVTANAAMRLGNYLYKSSIGAAGSVAADWLIDPHLLTQDDYTQGEIAIEVWGRLVIHAGLVGTQAILSAAPESATVASGVMTSNYGAIRYSEEYGSVGKTLVEPSSGEAVRFVRLGTLRLPVDRTKPLRWRLQLRMTYTGASAATIGCDYLMLAPLNGRALGPTGKANDANYPKFIASVSETTKTVRADLSGLVSKSPGAGQADHGLGGSLIELPYGSTDWMIKTSTLVPDDPTSNTTTEVEGGSTSATGAVHLAVTPRWRTARSS